MGDERGGERSSQGDGWVWGGVVRSWWQESHKVKAARVEVGGAPGTHHQDLFGVVVEGGDTRRHADGEGKPGHAGGEESNNKHVCVYVNSFNT